MNLKTMAGTLTIIVMLTTPTLAQANVASAKPATSLIDQSKIVGLTAEELVNDITSPNDDELSIQLKAARQTKQLATLLTRAKTLDVDITGLTNDQARVRIKAAERANTLTRLLADAKTLGIGINEKLV
ncbi:hypothetical protein [Desulfosporosinus sp. OT]|uniref:hypothetical protein n=1 Tax=Desulfosporosinus sp. OT TaxID=913865 RepID=UPI0002239F29|nr:hypothetical protein [Desulfosporosinus sp. OT]EGW35945.1 hypothetical protein DOT_6183 [Desulfosporosinus sp. OT]